MKTAAKFAGRAVLAAVLGALLLVQAADEASGQTAAVTENPPGSPELFVEVADIAPRRPFWLAIRLRPGNGAVTPWKNPGARGDAPRLIWDLPEGFRLGQARWPAPALLGPESAIEYGYKGPVLLLQEILPSRHPEPGASFRIGLRTAWPVCRAVCVLEEASFSIELTSGSGARREDTRAIFEKARLAAPMPSPWPLRAEVRETMFSLKVLMNSAETGDIADVDFFPASRGLAGSAIEVATLKGGEGIRLKAERSGGKYVPEVEGILSIRWKGDEAISAYLVRAGNAISELEQLNLGHTRSEVEMTAWLALLFAFLGGIILNLMPCVFPILTIKIFALVKSSASAPAKVRIDGLAYTAGILVSFLMVGLILLVARSFGEQVGWGFQLQSPAFVVVLGMVLFAVGLNFSGLYEIPSRIAGWGQSLSEGEGPMGAFFTGALATVVATPCTAPFMAGAVGFALSQAGPVAVGVFLALGMGLALPYLVISFVPALYRHFPKPGPWMDRLRKILAWPIYGTVAWLVWVLSHQVGGQGVWLALAALAALALMIWVLSRSGEAVRQGLRYSAAAGLALGLVWLTLLAGDLELRGRGAESLSLGRVETAVYDQELIQTSRLRGRPVFLNITAAWCLTCIVQEKLVFESAEFEAFFYGNNIILMTADWTNPDPEISDLLDRHQRSGIPFYLFYPGSPTDPPVELPVILTMDVIREYLSPHLKSR